MRRILREEKGETQRGMGERQKDMNKEQGEKDAQWQLVTYRKVEKEIKERKLFGTVLSIYKRLPRQTRYLRRFAILQLASAAAVTERRRRWEGMGSGNTTDFSLLS